MPLALELAPKYGASLVAEAMNLSRATLIRRLKPRKERAERKKPEWTLTVEEEKAILDVLHSEEFVDVAPAEVVATLMDEKGLYLGSTRTYYRVLAKHQEVKERRNQLIHPVREVPRLVARGPNQVWSWDITKLLGPVAWTYFYLYVILDIFSRYVVGWLLASQESTELAKQLVEETFKKQGVEPGTITLHSDLGPQMKAKPFIALTAKLGIANSFSRPRVSNDNPFSESQFRTLKYRPDFPGRFGSQEDAESHCQRYFGWYNREHRHSGIAFLTPEMVHYGRASEVIARRTAIMAGVQRLHPERFSRGPRHSKLPTEVWINNPLKAAKLVQAA